MEITVANATCGNVQNITFSLTTNQLTGILTDHLEVLDLFRGENIEKGTIHYKGVPDCKDDPLLWKNQVAFLSVFETEPNLSTVKEWIRWYCYEYDIPLSNLDEVVADSFETMELSQDLLIRKWSTLSSSEQFWIRLALITIRNPKVLILEEPFSVLDDKGKEKLKRKLKRLSEKPGRIILIGSRNSDTIAETCEKVILFFHHSCVKVGKTNELFTEDVESLIEKGVTLPKTISFVHKVKQEKKIRLMYQIDILDVIKDVYKHVSTK